MTGGLTKIWTDLSLYQKNTIHIYKITHLEVCYFTSIFMNLNNRYGCDTFIVDEENLKFSLFFQKNQDLIPRRPSYQMDMSRCHTDPCV
jgi:hypothetical protein